MANLKELNEIFNTQLCMLDKGEGNNLNTVVHGTGSKHPDPDALVLYYGKEFDYKVGVGKQYFYVKSEFPNLNKWKQFDSWKDLNDFMLSCNWIPDSIHQHQNADVKTKDESKNAE